MAASRLWDFWAGGGRFLSGEGHGFGTLGVGERAALRFRLRPSGPVPAETAGTMMFVTARATAEELPGERERSAVIFVTGSD